MNWDISTLDEGAYELVIQVTDELGLQGTSAPLPMTIVVEGRVETPVQEAVQEAAPAPVVSEPEPQTESVLEGSGGISLVVAIAAAVIALLAIVIVIIVLMRRREPQVIAIPAAAQPASAMDHDATQVIMPAFAAGRPTGAYLEPLENVPEHSGHIQLQAGTVAIGRDPKLSDIVLNDKSVSRLHARISESGGRFQLYDEGSASGTYINFEQVGLTPQALNDNDDIHIGRVHVRFHVGEGAAMDDDATQIMPGPMIPGARSAEPAQAPAQAPPPVDEDISTQPYMPHQPAGGSPPPAQQRPEKQPPPQQKPAAPPPADDDDEDISTQPYMPHSPKR
jgi:pSer/pThr/pTyr-binding forkhead associated (FHA) protein